MSGRRHVLADVPGLPELLDRQAGLARRSQLAALGVTSHHVAEQVAAGRWSVVAPRVVAADNGRLDAEQLRWRAVLNAPAAWLGGRSALEHLGLSGYPPTKIHVLVPRDHVPPSLPGVAIHVTIRLAGLDAPSTGLAVTSAARAAVDAAAWERYPRAAAGVVLATVQQRLATSTEIAAELAVSGRVRHRAVVRDALAEAGLGAESLAEVDVVRLLHRAGLTSPRRQVRSSVGRHDLEADLPDGRVLVVEVDGPSHDSPESRWSDAERDAALAAEGKLLLRIPAYAVTHDALAVVDRLRAIDDAARRRALRSREG